MRRLRAWRAGRAGGGAGTPLEAHWGVAPKRGRPDGSGGRRCCDQSALAPVRAFGRIFAVLPHRSSGVRTGAGAGLHPRDVAREQGKQRLGLRGLGGKLVVEREGLDRQGGGTLVLPVADHC